MTSCLKEPGKLCEDAGGAIVESYKRSMILQDIFIADYRAGSKISRKDKLALAIGHLKATYIGMASHYSVEAHMDDAFIHCPWHLPNIVHQKENELRRTFHWPAEVNFRQYVTGMRYDSSWRLSPDLFRFSPLLASLLMPYVTVSHVIRPFRSWKEFSGAVVERLSREAREVFENFALAMDIDLERAVFAGWRMIEKDVRKRGWKFLYNQNEAYKKFQQLNQHHLTAFAYFASQYELVNAVIGRRKHREWQRLTKLMLFIEHYNSYIGCYKFIPWQVSDENFKGSYLPYAIMRQEKSVLYETLRDTHSSVWLPPGYWFRDVLGQLLVQNPSMYAKWFIPLLEKGYIEEGIMQSANQVCLNTLKKLMAANT